MSNGNVQLVLLNQRWMVKAVGAYSVDIFLRKNLIKIIKIDLSVSNNTFKYFNPDDYRKISIEELNQNIGIPLDELYLEFDKSVPRKAVPFGDSSDLALGYSIIPSTEGGKKKFDALKSKIREVICPKIKDFEGEIKDYYILITGVLCASPDFNTKMAGISGFIILKLGVGKFCKDIHIE